MPVLVVSATRAEAAHVPAGLPVVVTGVGKTAAAVATATALAARDRSGLEVVNIGSAGALRPDLKGLYLPSTVLNHDMSAEAVRALGLDPHERLRLDRGDGTTLASGDVFVTDPQVRDRLAHDADLVDMEGYAVAYAAQAFDVPVRLVKHVSDNADESALDWPSLVDLSARALGGWLEQHL